MESRELQGRVARLHYQHGMTHQEIGDLLGLSRVKVTRLLADARRSGIVEITIHSSASPFGDLEAALVGRFGLQQVWIAPSFADERRTTESVGMAGAECLRALVPTSGTVAVGLSSSVAATAAHVHADPAPELGFVPLAGSWGGISRGMNPHEVALRLGSAFGARTYHLPAPILASSPETAAAFRSDPGVQETMRRAADADLLIAGVGGMEPRAGLLIDELGPSEQRQLTAGGAVGDISARFFDDEGRAVSGDVDGRVVGLSLDQLSAIPHRVAVSFGPHKVRALETALRAGLMNMVVTDAETATALVDPAAGNTSAENSESRNRRSGA
ncbi:DNA-binding transcriptional regulator LsrR (DeoR family) [Prauserella sediminis]|uniref:DNA-binding transcriptional regulator LsrR (DeoR family) n=1 Tax=Prauserella sediminis TaxID=577680 RepID=A0A839XZL0_9PSEU|nr:sugar-binding transcriptional regulator [Prauserella sediminis]MBB3665155.1 DNA-binding transcriptional regulator LsrR (DeoR family) [Prauserella sediminis]